MQAWHQSDNTPFSFYNAHDLNRTRDSSLETSIKRQLTERLTYTNAFVVLIGEKTRYLYKFVRWEMEQALSLGLPIIGVNLNGLRSQDSNRCPPIIKNALAIYTSFNARILQHALETWPHEHAVQRSCQATGPFFYDPDVYKRLGL